MSTDKVAATITKMFIEKIEERRAAGEKVVAPWRKPWNAAAGADRNLVSDKPYRGGNVWMAAVQGYSSPYWATRSQIKKLGGEIKRGDDGKQVPYTPITLWVFPTPEEKLEGKPPYWRFYQVWNVEQTTGLEDAVSKRVGPQEARETLNPIGSAQAVVSGWVTGPPVCHGGNRACYTPSKDAIRMPDMQAFESAPAYYRTLFHELTHATGHRKRLARDGVVNPIKFGSHDYSEEELIAEMGAGMLANHTSIATEEEEANSAAYLDHWLAKLAREPGWLVSAGGKAQKAVDKILGVKWGE